MREVFQAALDWYGDDPNRWCQDTFFVDRHGRERSVPPIEEDVCKACLVGTLLLVTGCTEYWEVRDYADHLVDVQYDFKFKPIHLEDWNDTTGRTFDEVVGLLRKAVA